MPPNLRPLATTIPGSPTMGAAASAGTHPDPIVLAVGEPSELPPDPIVEAAHRALTEGRTRYGPAAGLPELRARLAALHSERTGIHTTPDHVIITAGGKPALIDSLRCTLSPGDEALVLAPYWPSFLQQLSWCGATPIVIPPGAGSLPDPGDIDRACTPRTRLFILNSPSNPSGRVFPADLLRALGEIAKQRDLWILSDEVYRDLALDGPAPGPLKADSSLADRTIVVESFSKRFGMTGYRLGAAIGPPDLIAAMTRLAQASSTHPSMISQAAGIAALELDGTWEHAQLERYRTRRELCLRALSALPGVQCERSEAAFYLFPDVRGWMNNAGFKTDTELAADIGARAGVFLVPGSAFGSPGHLRLSYGLDEARLTEAFDRLQSLVS